MEHERPFAGQTDAAFTAARGLWNAYARRLSARGKSLVTFLDLHMETLILWWIAAAVAIACVKIAYAPRPPYGLLHAAALLLPYLLVALAPIAGYRIATGSFPRGTLSAQPAIRLCRYGTWDRLDELSARASPAFGPAGFMVSLLIGLLLNVPVRSLEFFASVPALGVGAPIWAQSILVMMTLDVIAMNFFYMVCFVLALRAVPLFPRMLLFAWGVDIMMQLSIARVVAGAPDLPPAVATAMSTLLTGNIEKVLISATIWLPYLILSERVNITFRHRARA